MAWRMYALYRVPSSLVIDRKRYLTLVLLYGTSTTGHYGLYHHLHTVLRDHTLRDKSTGTLSLFD